LVAAAPIYSVCLARSNRTLQSMNHANNPEHLVRPGPPWDERLTPLAPSPCKGLLTWRILHRSIPNRSHGQDNPLFLFARTARI
jgi:hypothetical protein